MFPADADSLHHNRLGQLGRLSGQHPQLHEPFESILCGLSCFFWIFENSLLKKIKHNYVSRQIYPVGRTGRAQTMATRLSSHQIFQGQDQRQHGLNSTRGTNLEAHGFNGWTARGHQPSGSGPINESWHALRADPCRCTDCDQMGL